MGDPIHSACFEIVANRWVELLGFLIYVQLLEVEHAMWKCGLVCE